MLGKIFVYTIDKDIINVVIINHDCILFYGLLVYYLFLGLILGFGLGMDIFCY